MKTEAHLPLPNIRQLADDIISCGKISRADQQRFMSALLSLNTISKDDLTQINRVFDLLRNGRLRVVD
jgi:hypothetical protein